MQYDFCAVSAGTYCYESYVEGNSNAYYDICPKGWRLPTGSYAGEFKALYESYDNDIDSFISVFKIASRYSTSMNTVMWASTNSRVKSSSHDPVDALEMIPTNTVNKIIDTITGINGRDFTSNIRCIPK